ncbi:hypothetical protein CCACVL1_00912 [Corchorus capsularis]|uniref:Uncharacterized protein n=1 Tax=Corchorus capsularis TaxID=210143 RepID=A0A1R3KTW0_COCAP|nr:hypothetical protein CCACVL1_00912 [Corchorus capsularis]
MVAAVRKRGGAGVLINAERAGYVRKGDDIRCSFNFITEDNPNCRCLDLTFEEEVDDEGANKILSTLAYTATLMLTGLACIIEKVGGTVSVL